MNLKTENITVTVNYDKENGFSFDYQDCKNGTKVVTRACNLEYVLNDNTEFELSFAGVAFSDPFNDVITEVEVKRDSVIMKDPFSEMKSVSFQFGFNIGKMPNGKNASGLLLLSADPEVINRDQTCPPPNS